MITISHFREQRIILLARLNLGIGSKDKDEIELYKYYQQINKRQIKQEQL